MVPLLGSLVYRIKPQCFGIAGGICLATVGLASDDASAGTQTSGSINRGDLLTFCCALAFAAHIVTLGHFAERMSFECWRWRRSGRPPCCPGAVRGGGAAACKWRPAVFVRHTDNRVLATALAFTVQAWAQQYTTSTRTALIYMLEPVVAWITSYSPGRRGLSARAAAGAALILGGVRWWN